MWTWYFKNGTIDSQTDYGFGIAEGPHISNYETGESFSKYSYRDDERHGACYWFSPEGEVQYIRYYSDGVMTGYSFIGTDGKPVEIIPFQNQTGKMETKYRNGNTSYFAEYKNGFMDGKSNKYFANGKVQVERTYSKDQLHGTFKKYHLNGTLSEESQYYYGNLNGEKRQYHTNGNLKSIERFILGEKYGLSEHYDTNGKLTARKYFYNDREIKQ